MNCRSLAVSVIGVLLSSCLVSADEPVKWLLGGWVEEVRKQDRESERAPNSLHVEVADGALRIVEGGEEGEDLRCRLDGIETRYRHTKRRAAASYALKCKIARQSVEVHGRFVTIPSGNPPVVFELQKKYQLSKDGSLDVRDRLSAPIEGVMDMTLWDEKTRFRRTP
jgi:hypothetical protein